MKQIHIKISGKVQGVFFRAHAQDRGRRLKLTGWVKNADDGGVEIMVQGEQEALEEFLVWCRKGPNRSRVDHVEIEWMDPTEVFDDFNIC